MRSLLSVLLIAFLATARDVRAQLDEELFDPRDNTKGWVFGLRGFYVPPVSASGEGQFDDIEIETTWGSGLGVLIGYGYTQSLLFYGQVDQSVHDPDNAQIAGGITLYHFDFGARYHLRLRDPRFVPYAALAFGGKQLYTKRFIDPETATATRATINALSVVPGGGIQIFLSENFAFDANAAVSIGSFRRISILGTRQRMESNGAVTARISVGVNWYPET